MQPCPVCGGIGVDANGYCTQCRTYRGVPQPASPHPGTPPQPYSGAPYSGPPYSGAPYSGPPYSGPPYSGAPYAGYPTSGSPMGTPPATVYPATTYGGAYGVPTAPPAKSRSAFTFPLIALSATLVVLVAAIVVVVVVRSGGDGGAGPANPTPTKQALVDACVVGTWEMRTYSEDVPVTGVGSVPFKLNGKGATMKFSQAGKGSQDFGTGTLFTGTVTAQGQSAAIDLKITGAVRFDYRTNDNTMSFSNLDSDGKATVSSPATGQSQTEDFKGSNDPSKYTCSGDDMSMSTSTYRSELKRVSKDA